MLVNAIENKICASQVRTRIEGGIILYRMVRKGLKSWEAGEEVMLTFGRRIYWVEGVFEESWAISVELER